MNDTTFSWFLGSLIGCILGVIIRKIIEQRKIKKINNINLYKSKFFDVDKETLIYIHWYYYGEDESYRTLNQWTKDQILDLVIEDLMIDNYTIKDFPEHKKMKAFLKYKG